MTNWESKFAAMRSQEEQNDAKARAERDRANELSLQDRKAADEKLRNIVYPYLQQVASAANKHAYQATTNLNNATIVKGPGAGQSFASSVVFAIGSGNGAQCKLTINYVTGKTFQISLKGGAVAEHNQELPVPALDGAVLDTLVNNVTARLANT